jgi:hypothetical protein
MTEARIIVIPMQRDPTLPTPYKPKPTVDPAIDPHSNFEPLRVRVVAPRGTELVATHPARRTK